MLLKRNFELFKTTENDELRPALKNVLLNVDDKQLIASNGYMVALVDVDVSDKDETRLIPANFLKTIMTGKKAIQIDVTKKKIKCGNLIWEDDSDISDFPNYKNILPADEKSFFELAINPELLYRLACSLGSKTHIILKFRKSQIKDQTTVRGILVNVPDENAFGIIMPIKHEVKNKK
jgi:hypothetical protein